MNGVCCVGCAANHLGEPSYLVLVRHWLVTAVNLSSIAGGLLYGRVKRLRSRGVCSRTMVEHRETKAKQSKEETQKTSRLADKKFIFFALLMVNE